MFICFSETAPYTLVSISLTPCYLLFCCCSVTKLWKLFVTSWTAAHQAPQSFAISQSLLKFMSIELDMVVLSNRLILYHPFSICLQSFPASESQHQDPMSLLFASGGQSTGDSALVSVLTVNIEGWFPLWLTGLISLQSKGLSQVSSTMIWKHQFLGTQPSLQSNSHICTWLLGKP